MHLPLVLQEGTGPARIEERLSQRRYQAERSVQKLEQGGSHAKRMLHLYGLLGRMSMCDSDESKDVPVERVRPAWIDGEWGVSAEMDGLTEYTLSDIALAAGAGKHWKNGARNAEEVGR